MSWEIREKKGEGGLWVPTSGIYGRGGSDNLGGRTKDTEGGGGGDIIMGYKTSLGGRELCGVGKAEYRGRC